MAKEIHILLSRKQWEELEKIKEKTIFLFKGIPRGNTYEEYLEKEKKNPTMALFI